MGGSPLGSRMERWVICGTEKLDDLPKATQRRGGKARRGTQGVWSWPLQCALSTVKMPVTRRKRKPICVHTPQNGDSISCNMILL